MSISMYSKPSLPGEFRASSRPVVSKVPGAPFSGPVARGFETSAMPLHTSIAPRMLPSCISSSLPCDLQKLILLDNILSEHIQYFPVEDDSGVDEG